MNREEIIELTNKIYRMTLLFPKKEPLRYKIRETADELLSSFAIWEVFHNSNPGKFLTVEKSREQDLISEIKKNFQILKCYFEVVKWQNWVSYFEVLELEEKYDKIEGNFEKEIKEEKTTSPSASVSLPSSSQEITENSFLKPQLKSQKLDTRKNKILKILKERGKAQVWEVKKVLGEVSKRTIRRDFEQLLKQGLIERIGERNNTFYRLREK